MKITVYCRVGSRCPDVMPDLLMAMFIFVTAVPDHLIYDTRMPAVIGYVII